MARACRSRACAAGSAVGTVKLSFSNSVGICMTDTSGGGDDGDSAAAAVLAGRGSGSSGGVDWRVAVGASVSVALLMAAVTLVGILVYARMQRRALLAKEEATQRELANAPPWQQARPDAPRCGAGLDRGGARAGRCGSRSRRRWRRPRRGSRGRERARGRSAPRGCGRKRRGGPPGQDA